MSPRPAGYRDLVGTTVEDIVTIHAEVTRTGRTWDVGIRDSGSLDFLVERIREMALKLMLVSRVWAQARNSQKATLAKKANSLRLRLPA